MCCAAQKEYGARHSNGRGGAVYSPITAILMQSQSQSAMKYRWIPVKASIISTSSVHQPPMRKENK